MIDLPTSVYSANRGYAWSNVPTGLSAQKLNDFCRMISQMRGDFPDPTYVEMGLISDGTTAAAFTLQNVDRWDSAGRSSDYFALAFFPVVCAKLIDFVELINNDFFWTPSHEPATKVSYGGPASANCPDGLLAGLRANGRVLLDNPRAVGSLLAAAGTVGERLICRMCEGNVFEVTVCPANGK